MPREVRLVGFNHVLSVVAEEHVVDDGVRTNLDVRLASGRDTCNVLSQRSTVTTHIETAIHDGRITFRSSYEDRHLLCVRTDKIEGCGRFEIFCNTCYACCSKHFVRIVVEVLPIRIVFQVDVVGIRVRAVTSTINVTFYVSHDTYSIAGIDVTRDIVTAIYVVDFTSQHSDTCSVTCRNVVRVILRVKCYLRIRHRCGIVVVIERLHVSFTTTAIDVIDHHSCTFNLHKQTFRTGHTSLVTATIEVADPTLLQVPSGTDSHIRLVVSAKETSNLVFSTAWIRESGVDPH